MAARDGEDTQTDIQIDSLPDLLIKGEDVLDRARDVSEAVDKRVRRVIDQLMPRSADVPLADA